MTLKQSIVNNNVLLSLLKNTFKNKKQKMEHNKQNTVRLWSQSVQTFCSYTCRTNSPFLIMNQVSLVFLPTPKQDS